MRRIAVIGLVAIGSLMASVTPAAADPVSFDLQAHRGGRGETTEESLRSKDFQIRRVLSN